jgi:AraC family transcriptional activator of mtrCDE
VLLDRLLETLAVRVRPFATCDVSPDWRLRMDGLNDVILHFVLSGTGDLWCVGARHALGRGMLAIVPAHLPHSLSVGHHPAHETTARVAGASEDELSRFVAGPPGDAHLEVACGRVEVEYATGVGLFDRLREPLVLDFSGSAEMEETFRRLLYEQRRHLPTSGAMMSALMNQCIVLVFRRLCDRPDCPLPWLTALEDPHMAAALAAILDHPHRDHSVESLAAEARMSRSAFAEGFAASFGQTPMAFLRDVRLRRAAALLRRGNVPVASVASRVGFSSRSHFSRAFRARFGVSPTEFRNAPPDGQSRTPSGEAAT